MTTSTTINRRTALTGALAAATAIGGTATASGAVRAAEGETGAQFPAAALARMEQIVDVLRNRYVRRGWAFDESAAEDALRYFRRWAAGDLMEDDDDPDDFLAQEFIRSHGQSFDWVFFGDPGVMIADRAARSARVASLEREELV